MFAALGLLFLVVAFGAIIGIANRKSRKTALWGLTIMGAIVVYGVIHTILNFLSFFDRSMPKEPSSPRPTSAQQARASSAQEAAQRRVDEQHRRQEDHDMKVAQQRKNDASIAEWNDMMESLVGVVDQVMPPLEDGKSFDLKIDADQLSSQQDRSLLFQRACATLLSSYKTHHNGERIFSGNISLLDLAGNRIGSQNCYDD